MAIPYLDTLDSKHYHSGEVVELVVSTSVSEPALLLMMRHFSELMVTLGLANFYGKKAEVTFEGVTYSSPAIINKEELLGEWQVFKRAVF